jgi:trehalose synthase
VALTNVPVAPLRPERLRDILTTEQAERFARVIEVGREQFAGRVVWNVNSTALGGGVAELLSSLIGYTRGAGIDARWVVIDGDARFFALTKRIHNLLHGSPGDGGPLGDEEATLYRETSERNARELAYLARPQDVFLLHDPQTAGLVAALKARNAHVVWRCHVGVDLAGDHAREAWRFLLPHLEEADGYVFSREAFVWDGLDPSRITIVPPSIDAFSPKNQELAPDTVRAILRSTGIETGGEGGGAATFARKDGTSARVDRTAELSCGSPLPADARVLLQVSRWDRLKDHAGVIEAFAREIAPSTDAHLALAGPSPAAVADDPEGLEVLAELAGQFERLPAATRERVHVVTLPMEDAEENWAIVNALQRRADVIAQKSLAEGFGLTVAEGMWKARPMVASRVGGIRDQIEDGQTGVLVDPHDLEGFGNAVLGLLGDRDGAERMGRRAQEAVRELFLGARHLIQYADLFSGLLGGGRPAT